MIRTLNEKRNAESLDLGLGEPALRPEIADFEAATRWVAEHGCRYTANAGDPELRAAIAAHYAYPGMSKAENVCVMTGSQEAVYVAIKTLLDPARDELLVVEPAFGVYVKIAEVEGIAVRTLSLRAEDGFAFDAERILAAVEPQTRMIVICSPCNPTGRTISRGEAAKLAAGLADRAAPVYVLHDEIYRELVYRDDAASLGELYPRTIAVNSLSKSNALTGLRLGWVVAPAEVLPQIVKMHAWTTSCPSTYAQRVALEIFHGENRLSGHRAWYARQRELALEGARAAGLRVIEPDGAFYLSVRAGGDSVRFALELVERKNVVAIPGAIFGESFEGWLRTSFVAPGETLRAGYARIKEAILAGAA